MSLNTNILYWLTATPNIGADFALSKHVSLSVSAGYNAFNFPDYIAGNGADANPKLHHWTVRGEGRYWFDRSFRGWYMGIHSLGGQYNAGGLHFPAFLRDFRYEGWAAGAGLSVGYRLNFGKHWGLEASIGAGLLHLDYTKYDCGSCGSRLHSRSRNIVAPTKAAVSISYLLPAAERKTPAALAVELRIPEPDRAAEVIAEAINAAIPAVPDTMVVEHNAVITDTARFVIQYPVDVAEFRPDFSTNQSELLRIQNLLDSIMATEECRVEEIRVEGFASPEYGAEHNLRLSERRACSTAGALAAEMILPPARFSASGEGDDWEGLCKALEMSEIDPDGNIAATIRQHTDADALKETLKGLGGGRPYRRMLTEIYPCLRRTEIVIIYSTAKQ